MTNREEGSIWRMLLYCRQEAPMLQAASDPCQCARSARGRQAGAGTVPGGELRACTRPGLTRRPANAKDRLQQASHGRIEHSDRLGRRDRQHVE